MREGTRHISEGLEGDTVDHPVGIYAPSLFIPSVKAFFALSCRWLNLDCDRMNLCWATACMQRRQQSGGLASAQYSFLDNVGMLNARCRSGIGCTISSSVSWLWKSGFDVDVEAAVEVDGLLDDESAMVLIDDGVLCMLVAVVAVVYQSRVEQSTRSSNKRERHREREGLVISG